MPDPITEQDLEKWERLEKAATPGPWKAKGADIVPADAAICDSPECGCADELVIMQANWYRRGEKEAFADAACAAAFRTAGPRLIAEVRRLRGWLHYIAFDSSIEEDIYGMIELALDGEPAPEEEENQ